MSQSPLDSSGQDGSLQSYRQGWSALNRLLHENKSFSGRETNNAFLNCRASGRTRFADISSAIGWDFADDARAIAQVDWDHDGDLDVWVTNRTAPRLRLLENTLAQENHFVSFLLKGNGKTTNRDGIGARVSVKLKGESVPLIRTLHAGHSFLSQQSRHVHFGLGKEGLIESVSVDWPGGKKESFQGIIENGRYLLKQDSLTATALPQRKPVTWKPGPQPALIPEPIARIVPSFGQILPEIITQRGPLQLNNTSHLQLWSPTCSHCLEKLPHWKNSILLATENDEKTLKICEKLFAKNDIKQDVLMLTLDTMELLDAFQSSLVDLWLPLPVPSSFLVTQSNEVLAVYRGPVDESVVMEDRALSSQKDRRLFASPFTGIWIADLPTASPQRVANQLQGRGANDQAIRYLHSTLKSPPPGLGKHELTNSYLSLGQLLGVSGKPREAIPPLKKAFKLMPEDVRVALLLATAYQELGDFKTALKLNSYSFNIHPQNINLLKQRGELQFSLKNWSEAIPSFEALLKANPDFFPLRLKIAEAHCRKGTPQDALLILKNSLRANPRYLEPAAKLSQILSTHPDESVRSPEEALMLAERLCQVTANKNFNFIFTKAMALANAKKFQEAETFLALILEKMPTNSSLVQKSKSALVAVKSGSPIRNLKWAMNSE